jgi:hypothetical protein
VPIEAGNVSGYDLVVCKFANPLTRVRAIEMCERNSSVRAVQQAAKQPELKTVDDRRFAAAVVSTESKMI